MNIEQMCATKYWKRREHCVYFSHSNYLMVCVLVWIPWAGVQTRVWHFSRRSGDVTEGICIVNYRGGTIIAWWDRKIPYLNDQWSRWKNDKLLVRIPYAQDYFCPPISFCPSVKTRTKRTFKTKKLIWKILTITDSSFKMTMNSADNKIFLEWCFKNKYTYSRVRGWFSFFVHFLKCSIVDKIYHTIRN